MIDIEAQINHWKQTAAEDWQVATDLLLQKRWRYALFFAHLATEKILKAQVCRHTQDLAPRLHNLVRLAEVAEIRLPDDYLNILADLNPYNIEGRYPDSYSPPLNEIEVQALMERTHQVYQWLAMQFDLP
jgi:HEPN domain-containing protein